MLEVVESQGRAPTSNRIVSTLAHPRMEVGSNLNRIHHRISHDIKET